MKTYFYIHGYSSSVLSETANKLRAVYPNLIALTYDYNFPEESVLKLAAEINSYPGELVIIGSSLGGWYAERLTEFVSAVFVLYNPATDPATTLLELGVSSDVAIKYKKITPKSLPTRSRIVILCSDDDVIDHLVAESVYLSRARVVYSTGGHRVGDIKTITEEIRRLRNYIC